MQEEQRISVVELASYAFEDLCLKFDLPFGILFGRYVVGELLSKEEIVNLLILRDNNTDDNAKLFPLGGPGTFLNASLCYAFIRYFKCKKILETGVANGYYSSFLLSAAIENGAELHSVELSDNGAEVAKYVPTLYKPYDKWKLQIGMNSLDFLKNIKNMDYDFYCHDSLHTFDHMSKELFEFQRCNKDQFLVYMDDQNDDNFWNKSLEKEIFQKDGYDVNYICGTDTRLRGHIGGFLKYDRKQ